MLCVLWWYRSLQLLSLTATFVPTLLARGERVPALGLLAALQEQLASVDSKLLSSEMVQVGFSSAPRQRVYSGWSLR